MLTAKSIPLVAALVLADIVISDVFMPKMDGFQLCQEIRKLDKSVPIVSCAPER